MPGIDSELASGVNQDNLLNVKIDTQERMRDLYEGFNIPDYQAPVSFIPKDLHTDTLVYGKTQLPTLDEALDSKDPNIQQAALQMMRQKASKSPLSKGIGFDNRVEYQEGQNKFTQDHWWKEKAQTMYGFNPYTSVAENEDFIHKQVWDNYSGAGKTWRGVGTFAGRVLSKLTTGLVGMVGDLGAIAWNGLQELGDVANINNGTKNNFWEDVSNNWLSRKMEESDTWVKDNVLPVYKDFDYDNKGAFAKILDPYTWQTSFADGVGFLAQFALPGAVFGKLGAAGKLARSIGALEEGVVAAQATGDAVKVSEAMTALQKAKNVSGFTKAMGYELDGRAGKVAEFFTGSDNVGGMSAHVFNTTMEAVSETKEGFNTTVDDLMRNKGLSRTEAVKKASENAPAQFYVNLAILTASNAFENKLLQKAIGNRAASIEGKLAKSTLPEELVSTTKLGKFLESNNWGNRIKFYGKQSTKATIFEGYWEENAQTATARWAKGDYDRQGEDGGKHEIVGKGLTGLVNQMVKQTKDASMGNDREAADSIMAGAVIGILGSTTFSKFAGSRKEIKDQYGNILKPKTFLPESQRKLERREKAQKVAQFTNNRDAWLSLTTHDPSLYDEKGEVIPEKLKEKSDLIAEKLQKIDSVFTRTVTAEKLADPQETFMLQHQVFADYVKAHILNGTGEQLVDRLKNWNKSSPEELALYGVSAEVSEFAPHWANTAQELVDTYKELEKIKYTASKDESVDSYLSKTLAAKSLALDYTALSSMSENLEEQYRNIKEQFNPFENHPETNAYNRNIVTKAALENLLKDVSLSQMDRDNITQRVESITKELKDAQVAVTALNDTVSTPSGLIFKKGTNVDKELKYIRDNFNNYLINERAEIDHKISKDTYAQLAKEYMDKDKGLSKYDDVVDFWDKKINSAAVEQDKKDKQDTTEEKKVNETKEAEKTKEKVTTAKTPEERKAAVDDIISGEELFGITQDQEAEPDEKLAEINKKLAETPIEPQIQGEHQGELLASETPFKTTNRETKDDKNKEDVIIPYKETVLEEGYDHDLTQFINDMSAKLAISPDKYEAVAIKDTEELFKPRVSPEVFEKYKAGQFKLGVVIVLREIGSKEFLKLNRKGNPVAVFSYNSTSFEAKKTLRAEIKAKNTGESVEAVLEFYRTEQNTADKIRTLINFRTETQIALNFTIGSLGIYPTFTEGPALQRFRDYTDGTIHVVKDTNDFPGDHSPGSLLMKIPSDKTDSGLDYYIPVETGKVTKELDEKLYNSLQALYNTTFKTPEEAALIVQNQLKKLYFTNITTQYFKVEAEGKEYKINHYVLDNKTGKFVKSRSFINLKLKLLEPLYKGTGNLLQVYNKDEKGVFTPTPMQTKEYKQLIDSTLTTTRKVLHTVDNKLYTKPVNAYLNLSSKEQTQVIMGDAEFATEDELTNLFGVKPDGTKTETNTTDIPKDIQLKINEVIQNKNFIKLSEDEKTYINTNIKNPDGTYKTYKRVTTFISDEPVTSNALLKSSQIIGTKVDELIRDFFAGNLKDLDSYDVSSKENITKFIAKLKTIKSDMEKRGEIILANDIILYNDELGVAGTVDLLSYDKSGNIRIYDMKTMRGNNFEDFYENDDKNKYETTRFGKSKKQKHTEQLSLYRILLNNTHGLKAKTIGILPIEIKYEAGDTTTSELVILKGVQLTPEDKVRSAKLIETKSVDIEKKKEELGLQKVLNIFPPDQGGDFRVIVKGDKYEVLVQFTKNKWDIFPKQKDGEYRASDPKTGNALVLSKEDSRKAVEKYLPIELINLLEKADTLKNIEDQELFKNGKIKEYISLYRKEWLEATLPNEVEKLKYYKSDSYPNKDSQERIIKEQEKLIYIYTSELAILKNEKVDEYKEITQEEKDFLKVQEDLAREKMAKDAEPLIETPEKTETALEKLRRMASTTDSIPEASVVANFRSNKSIFQFNFNQNTITPVPESEEVSTLLEDLKASNIYTVKEANINGTDVYLISNDRLNKFVVLKKDFNTIAIDKAVIDSKEYQEFKDKCK